MGENSARVRTEVRQDASDSDATALGTDHPDHPDAPIRDVPPVEDDLEQDSSPPTPRFIQDEGSWKRFKWVPYPVRRVIKATAKWARGPPNPHRYRIDPLFPRVQHAPIMLLDRYLPRKLHRAFAVVAFLGIWLLTFALVMREGLTAAEIPEWGTPSQIGCGSTYWTSGNGCGVDGVDCRPFTDGGFPFRCPASCASYQVLNPRAVGDQEIIYRQLVIGGPPGAADGPAVYRGDSHICGAAVHAGVISNTHGGCGVVKLIGRQADFNSTARNGITSIGFDSYFPLSFTFEPGIKCDARDVVWPLLAISVVFTTVFSIFVSSPALFFFPVFIVLYWTVGMATDTPNHQNIASLFSTEIGRFLPAMFVGWVMYDKMGVRRTLKGLTAQVEKTVLWLGAAWVGALTNYTLDFIPIQRLTPRDLNQQPGARAALAVIIIVLAAVAAAQVWFFRQEGRLIRNLKLYLLIGIGIIICVALPNFNLRIHHYILALLLLPGTSIQIRPSLLYQGLLIGLFVNGIARWGFDPFLQTDYALRGDSPMDSPLPSILAPTIIPDNTSITFSWGPPPGTYDGISVLVNDVERFREYFYGGASEVSNVTWVRDADTQANEYFRFAWMQGSQRGDYTKAGKWDEHGRWSQMALGPSRLRARDEDTLMRRRQNQGPAISLVYPSPPESTTSLLLLFHGLGDTELPFTSFARHLALPGVLGISVRGTAPLPQAFLSSGEDQDQEPQGYHWGDDIVFTAAGEVDADPGFETARRWVWESLIGEGGALALGLASLLRVAAAAEEGGEEKAFKGVVSVGGALPGSMVPTLSGGVGKAKTPVLVCCGRESEAVDEDAEEVLEREFEEVRVVRWKNRADDGMPRDREEVLPMMQFFAERLRSGWL
ncbi:hypothetical protein C8A00DRAFT_42654 [Chaetomidium leptoderma]|uniref:LCCL domain-containing protein n=1 Tax=Chaetomidium leptoderma TaxID=669021 RepID=A0AAN6VPN4_9PEZI|nr:hypothetical protein C8A00DRAFT_42654 [Chaetomidium leptoderma]